MRYFNKKNFKKSFSPLPSGFGRKFSTREGGWGLGDIFVIVKKSVYDFSVIAKG